MKRSSVCSLFVLSILLLIFEFTHPQDINYFNNFDNQDTLLPPSYFTAVDERNGMVPLYWFEPGLLPETISYDSGEVKSGMYVNVEWFDNAFGVRITPASAPFHLLKSEVFICYQGSSSDTSYNFSQPFSISVNSDSGGIPGSSICAPIDTYATGKDTSTASGEWVEVEHNLLFLDTNDFWIVFHWKEGFSLSPLVGVDSSPNCGRSRYGWTKYGYWEWSPLSYNIMIRAQIICNGKTPFTLKNSSQPDSFGIYRSKNPGDLTYPINHLSTLNSFQYDDKGVENDQTYYYKITAWYETEESEPSNEVMATPKRGAELWTNKDSLEVNLGFNQAKVENLILKNTGGLPLNFSVKIDFDLDSSYGGKDFFGYLWTDSDKKQELSFSWIDPSSEIVVSRPGDDNKTYGAYPLGFSFPFYENLFDSLYINTNGWISFDQPLLKLDYINKSLPSSTGPFDLVALFWDDLKVTDSSEVSYYSAQDTFVVNFQKLAHWFFGGAYTFQVILIQDGKMIFNYLVMKDTTNSATVGIQNEDCSFALPVVSNQNYIHDSLSLEILPGWVKVNPIADFILPADSLTLSLFFDSKFLSKGHYLADLIIEAKDKYHDLEPLIIPVSLNADTLTWVEEDISTHPISFSLCQNYPNPFNPSTAIRFTVHQQRKTRNDLISTSLKIFNIRGQLVRTLMDEPKNPGDYVAIWDGTDRKDNPVSSGVYFYQLKVGERKITKKMLKLK